MKSSGFALFVASVSWSTGPGPVTPVTPVERQMVGLPEKFDRWDENGGGYLTEPEWSKTKDVGVRPSKVVDFYDTDGDRRISLKEAMEGLSRFDEADADMNESR